MCVRVCICVFNIVINYKVLVFIVELLNSSRQNVQGFHVLISRVTILWALYTHTKSVNPLPSLRALCE